MKRSLSINATDRSGAWLAIGILAFCLVAGALFAAWAGGGGARLLEEASKAFTQ